MKFVVRLYAKNFVGDFLQDLKNLVGGRLKGYERMIEHAVGETLEAYHEKYGQGRVQDIIVREFSKESVMVIVYGR